MERAFRAAIRNVHRKRPLPSADGAEVRHGPVQTRQPEQALDKARRLAKRHPEKHFHGQASQQFGNGDPGRNRTLNLPIRSRLLYPVELRDRTGCVLRRRGAVGKPVARQRVEKLEFPCLIPAFLGQAP